MASRVTLKAVNDELAQQGYTARLAKAAGYFYFQFGEAANWLDRTVAAESVSSRSVEEWIGEFHRLEKLNEQIREKRLKGRMEGAGPERPIGADKYEITLVPAAPVEHVPEPRFEARVRVGDYPSVEAAKAAIDRYFRIETHFSRNPRRAGQEIWSLERVLSEFIDGQNCKDARYR